MIGKQNWEDIKAERLKTSHELFLVDHGDGYVWVWKTHGNTKWIHDNTLIVNNMGNLQIYLCSIAKAKTTESSWTPLTPDQRSSKNKGGDVQPKLSRTWHIYGHKMCVYKDFLMWCSKHLYTLTYIPTYLPNFPAEVTGYISRLSEAETADSSRFSEVVLIIFFSGLFFGLKVSFFLPVPCALEAQTVINTSCFDWRFPLREKRWDNDQGVTYKHKKQDSKPQHKQPNTQNQKGHLGSKVKRCAFRKVPMPLSTAPRWCSKYHS